jgi:hypothetical protein
MHRFYVTKMQNAFFVGATHALPLRGRKNRTTFTDILLDASLQVGCKKDGV